VVGDNPGGGGGGHRAAALLTRGSGRCLSHTCRAKDWKHRQHSASAGLGDPPSKVSAALCNLASLDQVHGPCGAVWTVRGVSCRLRACPVGVSIGVRVLVGRNRSIRTRLTGPRGSGGAYAAAWAGGGALAAAGSSCWGRIQAHGPGGSAGVSLLRCAHWRRRRRSVPNRSGQGLPLLAMTGNQVPGLVRLSRCSMAHLAEVVIRRARSP